MNDFPLHVLRDYALIADGERGAVIGPRGDIVWMCAPRWDSDAVFSALIGGEGIHAVTPAAEFVWGGYYENGSLVWRSRWITRSGITECQEALAYPATPDRLVVLRRVVAREVRPTWPCGSIRAPDMAAAVCGRSARTTGGLDGPDRRAIPALVRRRRRGEGPPGRTAFLPGAAADGAAWRAPRPRARAFRRAAAGRAARGGPAWHVTRAQWAQAVPSLAESLAPRDARQSLVVLRGLTSAGGGMVAAATTGLPERAEQGRNYDYRYAWIRDQCYRGPGDRRGAGPNPLLDDAVRFVATGCTTTGRRSCPRTRSPAARSPTSASSTCPATRAGAIVVGNWVNRQFQLDGLGEALLLLAAAAAP